MNYYVEVLKKYATFDGRARRKEYWFFVLFTTLISIVLAIVDAVIGTPVLFLTYGLLYTLYVLAVLIPGLAVLVRRLHDTDRSGWWALLLLIPCAGPIVIIIFCVLQSSEGENRFGPSPLEA